ncbi:MAG: DNA recombination protein RmuC [Gammaproteobacteria bacterium]|nr:DNA recombination protein RmuC [Gammaproteobacteria bacterium]
MMVVAIIVLLAVLALLSFVWLSYSQRQRLNGQLALLKTELSQLQTQRGQLEGEREHWRQQYETRTVELATLKERNRQGEEKIALLNETKTQLKLEFETLANRIFDAKGQSLLDQNRRNLDTVMSPFKTQLKDFKERMETLHRHDSQERVSLKHQLQSLQQLNQQMSTEAANLTDALKGNKKVQGNWGEMILQRVLEQSGLQQGREYQLQQSLKDEEQRLYRPDAIIHLPDGKDIIIDAKVSLNDYLSHCNSDDEEQKKQALSLHIAAVKRHIEQLSEKRYESLEGVRTLDFVFMFMSVEPAYLLAVQHEPTLFSNAFHKKILFVGPSTLLAALRIVETVWRHEDQHRNAAEIARQGGHLYEKFVTFVESLDEIGKHIDGAKSAYDTARNRLVVGRGNLVARCEKLHKLGVKKGKRSLPKQLVEIAEED